MLPGSFNGSTATGVEMISAGEATGATTGVTGFDAMAAGTGFVSATGSFCFSLAQATNKFTSDTAKIVIRNFFMM
jgi:hypothetical protein